MLEVIDRYAPSPGVDDVNAIIVVQRVSIADTPRWRVDTRTGQFYHSMAAGTGSKETYRWSTGRHDGFSFEVTNRTDVWSEDACESLGNSRTFEISIRPRHKHWDLENFERLPVNMSSYSSTSAPSTADLVIPTFDC